MLKRYREAVRLLRECASRLPNLQWPHLWLAAAYAQSGQLEEARKEVAEVLRSTRGSQLEAGNVLPCTRTPRMPSIISMGRARRGCRKVETQSQLHRLPNSLNDRFWPARAFYHAKQQTSRQSGWVSDQGSWSDTNHVP